MKNLLTRRSCSRWWKKKSTQDIKLPSISDLPYKHRLWRMRGIIKDVPQRDHGLHDRLRPREASQEPLLLYKQPKTASTPKLSPAFTGFVPVIWTGTVKLSRIWSSLHKRARTTHPAYFLRSHLFNRNLNYLQIYNRCKLQNAKIGRQDMNC